MAAELSISSLVQLLGKLLIHKRDFFGGVEGEVESLKDELNRMQSFLRDANRKQSQDDMVRDWISDIRDAALDAEEAIEMFIFNLKNPGMSEIRLGQDRIKEEIRSIRSRLDAIQKRGYAIRMRSLRYENENLDLDLEIQESFVIPTPSKSLVKRTPAKLLRKATPTLYKSSRWYRIKDLGEPGEAAGRSEVEERRRLAPWHKDGRSLAPLHKEKRSLAPLPKMKRSLAPLHEEKRRLAPWHKERRPLAQWHKDDRLVGVEDDVKKLLEQITDEEKKGLSVAAVVGMGGIGKSTLAREVYNHPDVVSGRFDFRAWIVLSNEYERTPQEMIKRIILEMTRSELEKQNMNEEIKKLSVQSGRDHLYLETELKELLHRRLEGKTFFIVLDNLWEEKVWASILTALPDEQDKTSRLLITTRKNSLTSQCQSLHVMKFLDPEKSWELFLKKGLTSNSSGEFPKELEQIGRQIVNNCNGLPLSITLMGGLLAETWSNRKWEEALKKLNSHMGREGSTILGIPQLSYQNLSSQLKCCFLCFAFFEEDVPIPVKRLVSIMVGLGFIQQMGRTATVEEIARGYLDELINRNVVMVKDLMLDNRVKSCYLHNFLHDMCLAKARDEISLDIQWNRWHMDLRKARHWIVKYDRLRSLLGRDKEHILSLFVINVEEDIREIPSSHWEGFQRLKILDLDYDSPLERLPDSFRLLLGLKQLRIHRQRNKIFFSELFDPSSGHLKLPTWLNTLKKLEVLDLGIELVAFPNVALEMCSLRHLRAYCVSGLKITDSWKNIETLKYIMFKDWMRSSLRLMDGCQVRELGLIMVDESSNVSASLLKLKNLVKLNLVWNYLIHTYAAIDISHLKRLTKLKLYGMMRKCPSASMFPPNLTHLTLENSFLDEDPMQELGKLPKLLYLKLKDHSYMGDRIQVLQYGFPSLIGLHLRELYELRKVVIKEGGMPQLKLLQVRDCHALDTKNLSNKSYQLQIQDTI